MLNHEHVQHFLPVGGWTWDWFGDPDQGFTKMQPGGWQFNILPYIEQPVLHDLGSNNNQAGRTATAQTPLSVLSCPSTARPGCTPTCRTPQTHSILTIPRCFSSALRGRNYAGNSGSVVNPKDSWPTPPSSFTKGKDPYSDAGWMSHHPNNTRCGGVIYQHSACRMAEITGRHEQHVPLRRERSSIPMITPRGRTAETIRLGAGLGR